ncbi:pyrroline-5-carboxylate reductase [Streptomyces sp. NPDC047000]|uniref:pyrroline-5-carboxylate reductase n=1 Tax=Streptomyces sp. NPDC047000 TaxID=3155474 RepID=UPI0033F291CA
MTAPRVAVVGAGSLARALLAGWAAAGTGFGSVTTVNRTAASAARTTEAVLPPGAVTTSLESDPDALRAAVEDADIVVMAVKPHLVRDVLPDVAATIRPGTVVLSVAAGVRAVTFSEGLPAGVHVLRAMPNTPSAVGLGVIGLVPDARVPSERYGVVKALLADLGQVIEVDEDQLDGVVAVSGSGPAYVFLLVEKLRDAAVAQGFVPETAATLARQVFRGAVELMEATGEDPAELRRKVTSPNGTTARAVAVFEEGGLGALFDDAVHACRARARELAS